VIGSSVLPRFLKKMLNTFIYRLKNVEVIDTRSDWLLLWNVIIYFFILFGFVITILGVFIVDIALKHIYVDISFDFVISTILSVGFSIDILLVRWRVRTISKNKLKANIIITA